MMSGADKHLWEGHNLHDLYAVAYTPQEWQPKLKNIAKRLGLHLLSTAFDLSSIEFLVVMDIHAIKIASFELVDLDLLRAAARTGKPIILSADMATLGEIEEAIDAVREAGGEQLVLLKCTSAYPADPNEMNLRTIPYLSEAFGVPVGVSDHTLDVAVRVVATAPGACVIERHLTISRDAGGPDSAFSLEPHEFAGRVRAV